MARDDREAGHLRNAIRPPSVSWSVTMTDQGLVCGAGSVLIRMIGEEGQPQHLATHVDEDRLVAMLSVVAGQPLSVASLMPHVEAASALWRRGDKALANLRLVFGKLPRPADPAAVDRLALSETLLDNGLAPNALIRALWPLQAETLHRYNPNQPRVPAGHGVESGRWEFTGGGSRDGAPGQTRIVVAVNSGDRTKNESIVEEKLREERELLGLTSIDENVAHGRPIDPFGGPPGVPRSPFGTISQAARAALDTVGPGKGPVYGTKVHTQFRDNIRALRDTNITSEQSYLNGKQTGYGTKGSIRADVVEGPVDDPTAVFDLKTGGARLSIKRLETLRNHLPNGKNVPIKEIKQ